MTVRTAGVREIALQAVREAEAFAERIRSNPGDALSMLEAEFRAKLAQDVLDAVDRHEASIEAWETDPARLAAMTELRRLETDGAEKIRAHLDTIVTSIIKAAKPVLEYNQALREAGRQVSSGDPTDPNHYYSGHPGEINLISYVVARLREATR